MTVVSTTLTLPVSPDQVVIATQDIIDQQGWRVHAISASEIVFQEGDFDMIKGVSPKIVATLKQIDSGTEVQVICSLFFSAGPLAKKKATGFMGQFVNSLSLRVQTNSVAINPTVQVGEGQTGGPSVSNDRYEQLRQAKELLEQGVLTPQEFDAEKARILAQ
jgi:hypothetical protein